MEQENIQQPKKSFFLRFCWLILIIVLIGISGIIFVSQNKKIKSIVTGVPVCPSNLSGVFTHLLVDKEKIAAVDPRGFVNGGDHVMPIVHQAIVVYFDQGLHPIYAPADMTITTISNHRVVSGNDGSESQEFY